MTPTRRLLSLCILPLALLADTPRDTTAARLPTLEATIGAIRPHPAEPGVLRILGSARGEDFSHFELAFGAGEFPESWTPIVRLARPVQSDLLAEWQTAALPSGVYTLRLTAYGRSGEHLGDRTVIDLKAFRPDLSIHRLHAQTRRDRLTVTALIENQGDHPTLTPFPVAFSLAEQPVLSARRFAVGRKTLQPLSARSQSDLTAVLTIPPELPDGTYYLVAEVDPAGTVVEGSRENNAALSPAPISLLPDLASPEIEAAVTAEGGEITVSGIIENTGGRPVRTPFSVRLLLSEDGAVGPEDPVLGEVRVEPLPAGAVTPLQARLAVPEDIPKGTYYLLALLDPQQSVLEADRANNAFWGNPVVLGPDLAIGDLQIRLTPDGRSLHIQDLVENRSRYALEQPVLVRYRLHPAGEPGRVIEIGSRRLEALSAGATSRGDQVVPLPEIPIGNYLPLGEVDPGNEIAEITHQNNRIEAAAIHLGPDLVITDLTAALQPDGENMHVGYAVRNQGGLPFPGPVTVRFSLSPDGHPDQTEIAFAEAVLPALDRAETARGSVSGKLPPGIALSRTTLIARVNPDRKVPETDFENNRSSVTHLLEKEVDLVLADLRADLLSDGRQVVISDTVKNLGAEDVEQPFRIAFYLSQDGVIDPEDVVLGERALDGLKASGSSTGSTRVLIPDKGGTGRFSVLGRADPHQVIKERRENNNDYWGNTLELGPDLRFDSIEGELSPDGREIAVRAAVRNQGNRPTPAAFQAAFYLATAQEGTAALGLGSLTIDPLEPGQVWTGASTFPIPDAAEHGEYQLLARLDVGGEIPETDETNNAGTGPSVSLGPDLVILSLKTTLAPQKDQLMIQIEDVIANQGNRAAAEAFEIAFVLSKDWAIDPDDLFLGSRAVNGLAPGESSAAEALFAVPPKSVRTGRYYVLATVDGLNQIAETNERNNFRPTIVPLVIRMDR